MEARENIDTGRQRRRERVEEENGDNFRKGHRKSGMRR